MKKQYILLWLVTLSAFVSCGKTPINGKLDGMWQLTGIEYPQGNHKDTKPEQLYYSFQLHLISLRSPDKKESLGRFKHAGDSLVLSEFRLKYQVDKLTPREELLVYGLNDTITRFKIESLTKESMILKSSYAMLFLRKF